MMTLEEFIAEHRLVAVVHRAESNPNMDSMPAGSSHWIVTIRNGAATLDVPYSMGPAQTIDDAERARSSYRAIDTQSTKLADLIGVDAFQSQYETHRL